MRIIKIDDEEDGFVTYNKVKYRYDTSQEEGVIKEIIKIKTMITV